MAIPAAPIPRVIERRGPWLLAAALALATAALYAPVLGHEFIAYDTPEYVLENPHVRDGLTLDGVLWSLTALRSANWHPLAWISHMLDCELFGLEPGGHHAVSALLHALNAGLLLLVLHALTGALGRSAFVAAVFALHPLRLESVAWVAERKDLLAGLFFIAALGAYARYARRPGRWSYAGLAALFGLGLASKAMSVTLPCVLLLLDFWPLGRSSLGWRRLVLEKLPLFALSAAVGVVTLFAQRGGGAVSLDLSPVVSITHAITAYALYLWKLLWPLELAVFYPHPGAPSIPALVVSSLLLGVVTGAALRRARAQPYLLVGWLWFVVTLLPVIGVLQVGAQGMADRYTYLPAIGVALAVAWGVRELAGRAARGGALATVAALLAVAALAWGTRVQLPYWSDTETLFTRALEVTGESWLAHHLVGASLFQRGAVEPAVEHLREAVRLRPADARIRAHLGAALLARNELAAAAVHLGESLRLDPASLQARFHMAVLAERRGRRDEALDTYRAILVEAPAHAGAHRRLGLDLLERGELATAEWHLRVAARQEPELPANHAFLGRALEARGRSADALASYARALEANPRALVPLRRSAWIRATHPDAALRDAGKALALAERLGALTGHRSAGDLDIQAAAYAEAGRYGRAHATAERAVRRAREAGFPDRAAAIAARAERYAAGEPYRDTQPPLRPR